MIRKTDISETGDTSKTLAGMTVEQNNLLFEAILEKAAEQLGDINPLVLEKFYALHPEAVGLFPERRLELMMIDQALYCVSVWLQRPMEIDILLRETVDHHGNCLRVPVKQFAGLFESLVATLREVVPAADLVSFAVLDSINHDLQALVLEAGAHLRNLPPS
tara:strand:- start:198 stop:683 length:486 start_codon:yes stop_codon:yes gene_type:complete